MKLPKLVRTVGICCALGSTSGAMAQCPGGLIQDETFDGDLVLAGSPCSIISSTIKGDVRVTDSDYLVMLNTEIGGEVRVIRSEGQQGNGVANIIANTVLGGNFMVTDHAVANIIENETVIGSIRVYGNKKALVQKNVAGHHLLCRANEELSAFVNFAREDFSCE